MAAVFVQTVKSWVAQVSAANTNRDGTGTIVTVATASASGSRIHRLNIKAITAVTAGAIRLYIHDGSNARLWKEIPVPATSLPNDYSETWEYEEIFAGGDSADRGGIALANGHSLRASTHIAETFNIIAHGGDYV